jgi:hypothetical protein
MCLSCEGKKEDWVVLESWATGGLKSTGVLIKARTWAKTYKNTFVFIFSNAVVLDGTTRDVFVDAHYVGTALTPGEPLLALGGVWAGGYEGMAMKPSQHGGDLLTKLKEVIPATAPAAAHGIYGKHGSLPSQIKQI